jgi:hypothetical protein
MSSDTIEQAVSSAHANTRAQHEYFQEIVELRSCLQWNADDYEFAQKGGRIVYLMDANIVVFFMNPALEAHHVDAFDSGLPGRHAVATALVTAEFLFSRRLNGQDGYPALIAPSHAEELGDVLGAIRPPADTRPEGYTLTQAARKQLETLIRRVRGSEILRDVAIKELRQLVPEFAIELLEGGFQEANQFLRLYREDLIRPLAVHSEVTREILDIRQLGAAEIEKWTNIILPERMGAERARANRHPRERGHHGRAASTHLERKRAVRDAEALIQTMRLDEDARDASQRTRYVLVTADRALFDAYARWFWTDGGGNQARFVLRHPLQYVPMLNPVDMPNDIERSDIFERTRNALDTLLAPLRAVDPRRYPQSLSIHRVLARVAANDQELQQALKRLYGHNPFELEAGSAPLFKQIKADWEEGFRDSIVLNAELMRRRARSEFEHLVCLLREDVDLRTGILQHQQKTLTHLEAAHLAVNTRVSVARLMGIDRTDGAGPPRGVLAIRATFPRIVGNASLENVLEGLASGRDTQLAHRIDTILQGPLDHQTLFFAACLAHRCSRWHTALHYGERALALWKSERDVSNAGSVETELHEIGYLIASATRYTWDSADAIRRAIALLAQGKAYAHRHNDQFGFARALCELCAVILAAVYRDCLLGGSTGGTGPIGIEDFNQNQMLAQLEATTEALTDLNHSTPSAALAAALETLEFQAWGNVIGAEVISHLVEPTTRSQVFRPLPVLLDRALTAMEATLRAGRYLPVVEAEHIMARFWNGRLSRIEAARLLQAAQERSAADKHTLTELDEAEFKRFATILDVEEG